MKYFITIFLAFFALSTRAQITLEHTYTDPKDFGLIQVDSGIWKYVSYNEMDSISIFNLDHSFDRLILVPTIEQSRMALIAKRLFDLDSNYEFLLSTLDHQGLRLFKDDGTMLFSCDTCYIGAGAAGNNWAIEGPSPPALKQTSNGTKMLVTRSNRSAVEVYSLPGKLPGCTTSQLGVFTPSIAGANPFLPTSAYPNPSTGRVRIAYRLPDGVSTGEVILTREDGTEVKRYRVTSAFSDLLIDGADLPSGAYFYKLVTAKGESAAQAIAITK